MKNFIYLALILLLSACGGGGSESTSSSDTGATETDTSDTTATDDSVVEIVPGESEWLINADETRSLHVLESDSGLGVLVNVQSVAETAINEKNYTLVKSNGIPDYSVTINQEILDELTSRPKANTDFTGGYPIVDVGDTVNFAQDIGYVSNSNCQQDAGYGYWPPGPDCPTESYREAYLPQIPQTTDDGCETGLGKIGLWVNGSSVYNWGDGMTYQNEGNWNNLAPIAEGYDVDICGGHAANGDYHHHFYSSCLADMVGDKADGHSPLYGYAADGYPIYGPWQAEGELAISSWTVRDYSANSATGCSDGARSCVLNDQYDISQGTVSVSSGPGFDETVKTLSSNYLTAFNGYYLQDYYWQSDLTEQGGAYLDQFNGHSDSERGYHYHITVTQTDGKLVPSFPFIVGLQFAGELDDYAIANCRSSGPGGR